MPRKKQEYALAEDGNGGLAPVRVASGSPSVPGVSSVQASEVRADIANRTMEWLCSRTDGWARISPDSNGIALHAKWKFTSSKWPNHYVYYRVDRGHWSEAIIGLAAKVGAVDRGELKPTFDTWYGEH